MFILLDNFSRVSEIFDMTSEKLNKNYSSEFTSQLVEIEDKTDVKLAQFYDKENNLFKEEPS